MMQQSHQCNYATVQPVQLRNNCSRYLQQFAAPGHWHDPDMLLVGNGCVTQEEARTQMAIWVRAWRWRW